jgi:hypothetical protein
VSERSLHIERPMSRLTCWVCGRKWWMVESLFRCLRSHDAEPHWAPLASDADHDAGFRAWAMSERDEPRGTWEIARRDARRLFEQLEATQERLLTLIERTRDELTALERWAGEQNAGNAFADQVRQWAMSHRERLDAVSSPAKNPS